MKRLALFAVIATVSAGTAEAEITTIVIDTAEPFADGMSFGEAGAYERVAGTAKGELDPNDPLNRGIVDLDKAPRNAHGRVEYSTEFFMLRPKDPAKGSGKLLYEVNNRGRKFLLPFLMHAPEKGSFSVNDPLTKEDAGDGLVFGRGYTVVWSGWDPDAPRANGGMAMTVPSLAKTRTIRDELVNGTRGPLADTFKLSYAAASLDTNTARLTLREKEAYPARALAVDRWAFVDERTIKLLPDGSKPAPGALYELTYAAKNPKVLGIGFAATRASSTSYVTSTAPGIPPRPACARRSLSASRRAGAISATSSVRASTSRRRTARSSTAC